MRTRLATESVQQPSEVYRDVGVAEAEEEVVVVVGEVVLELEGLDEELIVVVLEEAEVELADVETEVVLEEVVDEITVVDDETTVDDVASVVLNETISD